MSIKEVDKLYKKMISFDDVEDTFAKIDAGVRTEIFQKIIDDVERLLKKIKRCDRDSEQYRELDFEIRKLLMKEIQVIIDDYVIKLTSIKMIILRRNVWLRKKKLPGWQMI